MQSHVARLEYFTHNGSMPRETKLFRNAYGCGNMSEFANAYFIKSRAVGMGYTETIKYLQLHGGNFSYRARRASGVRTPKER